MAGINKQVEKTEDEIMDNESVSEQELNEVTSLDLSKYRGSATTLYINKIKTLDLLTPEEEQELAKRKDEGDPEAREALINHNLRLVIALAKKKYDHLRTVSVPNVSFDDLIQDGSLGLITAVDRFDWSKGLKFSTYAVYWIKQSINQGLSNLRPIKLPDHKINEVVVINRTVTDLETTLLRQPSAYEIYLALDKKFTLKHVQELLVLIQNIGTVSLDRPVDDDETSSIGDIVSGEDETPAEYTAHREAHEKMHEALNKLPKRDRLVIIMSFGLEGHNSATLSQISDELYRQGFVSRQGKPLSKEGIRLIKDKALQKLRDELQPQLGLTPEQH